MTVSVTVREASADDHLIIIHLLSEAGLSAENIRFDKGFYWIAIDTEEHPVGVIGLEVQVNACLLRSLAVSAPYRCRGYGSFLVRHVKKEAICMGCNCMYAFSTGAGQFFTHCGFDPVTVQEAEAALSGAPQVVLYRTTGALAYERAWRVFLSDRDAQ